METHYADIEDAVKKYLHAVRTENNKALQLALIDPAWTRKTLVKGGAALVKLDAAELSAEGEEVPAPAILLGEISVSSIKLFFGDFAVVRLDNLPEAQSAFLFVFKTADGWRVVSEFYSSASEGRREALFRPETSEQEILEVLNAYYTGFEGGDAALFEKAFHAHWHMKGLTRDDTISLTRRDDFISGRSGDLRPGYVRDRQISGIEIVYDSLAFARVDKPSVDVSTIFMFAKVDGKWFMIEKGWSS